MKPGDDVRRAHRRSSTNMQSSVDVISKHEIRKVKCCKETDLFDRQVNMVNHVLTHKCSSYCLKEKKIAMLFDPSKHREDDTNRFTANNRQMINIIEYICRMKFGTEKNMILLVKAT